MLTLAIKLEIRKRPSTEPDEAGWIEPVLEILQPVGDGMTFLVDGRDMQELAFGDDRRDLMDRDDQTSSRCRTGIRSRYGGFASDS